MLVTRQFEFQVIALEEQFWRSYEHLHNSVHHSNGCLDLRLDCFSRDKWVDSHSSCFCGGDAHFAFRSRQTRGSRPAHQQMIP